VCDMGEPPPEEAGCGWRWPRSKNSAVARSYQRQAAVRCPRVMGRRRERAGKIAGERAVHVADIPEQYCTPATRWLCGAVRAQASRDKCAACRYACPHFSNRCRAAHPAPTPVASRTTNEEQAGSNTRSSSRCFPLVRSGAAKTLSRHGLVRLNETFRNCGLKETPPQDPCRIKSNEDERNLPRFNRGNSFRTAPSGRLFADSRRPRSILFSVPSGLCA